MRFCSHFCSFSFQSQPQRRDQEEAVAAVAVHLATAVDAHHLAQAIAEDHQVVHIAHHQQDHLDHIAARLVRQDHTAARLAHLDRIAVHLVHPDFAVVQRLLVRHLHVRPFAQRLLHLYREPHQLFVLATKWQHVQYALQDHA